MEMIDLGTTYGDSMPEPVSRVEKCYPSLYISNMEEEIGEIEEDFYAKVKLCLTRCTETKDGYECEYKVKAMAAIPDKKDLKDFGDALMELAGED